MLAIKTIPGFPGEYLTVTFKRRIGREDVAFSVDAGNDLTFGMTAVQTGAIIADGTGGETLTYRHPQATSASAQQFLRVRATRVP